MKKYNEQSRMTDPSINAAEPSVPRAGRTGPAARGKALLNSLPDDVQAGLGALLAPEDELRKGRKVTILELAPPALYGVADGRAAFTLMLRPGKVKEEGDEDVAPKIVDLSSGQVVPASGLRRGSFSDIGMSFPVIYLKDGTQPAALEPLRAALETVLGPTCRRMVNSALSRQLLTAYSTKQYTKAKQLEEQKTGALATPLPFVIRAVGPRKTF